MLIRHWTAQIAAEKGLPPNLGVGYRPDGSTGGYMGTGYHGTDQVYAPTQSELHAWLRDRHNIHVDVQFNMHFCWQVRLIDIHGPGDTDYLLDPLWLANDYGSYEQALEAGLAYALTFLPSV